MKFAERILKKTALGARLVDDRRYRMIAFAVVSLILNLIFAFYNTILGVRSSSFLFAASAVYYMVLCTMRFLCLVMGRKKERATVIFVGVMLIILSMVFQAMAIVSIRYNTATAYGTIPMITIATFTFSKIITASISGAKNRRRNSALIKTINVIRYSEIAVSILTMQQSMLVSFGDGSDDSSLILNIFTAIGVSAFILALGVATLKRK